MDWAREHDRVAYEFTHDLDAIDLGLRLEDVEDYNLQSERCVFRGGFASDTITTEAERQFLQAGRRVELNAFTSPELVEWIESKLENHLCERLIPDDEVLADAYRRTLAADEINTAVKAIRERAIERAEEVTAPDDLRERLRDKLHETDTPWDEALNDLVSDSDNLPSSDGT